MPDHRLVAEFVVDLQHGFVAGVVSSCDGGRAMFAGVADGQQFECQGNPASPIILVNASVAVIHALRELRLVINPGEADVLIAIQREELAFSAIRGRFQDQFAPVFVDRKCSNDVGSSNAAMRLIA